MPFGQQLKQGIMSGFHWTKNLLQKTYSGGKQALGILDQGMNTGAGIYESLKPALENLAPESMQQGLQQLDTHVGKAQEQYNTIRNKIDSGEQRIRDNVGMVMGNLKKKGYDVLTHPTTGQRFHTGLLAKYFFLKQ